MKQKTNSKAYGNDGEILAVQFLEREGYQILQRNFRCKLGEIDIVARSEGYLCFIEVKRRKNMASGHPFEAISIHKIKRICKTALVYLRFHQLPNTTPIRFDVISIIGEEVSVLKDAFSFQC